MRVFLIKEKQLKFINVFGVVDDIRNVLNHVFLLLLMSDWSIFDQITVLDSVFKSIFHPVKKKSTTTTEINVSFSLFLSIETLLFYWFCSIYSTRHCFTVPLSAVIHRMDYKDVLSAYPTCSLLICYFVRQKRLFDVRHALFENLFFQVFFFSVIPSVYRTMLGLLNLT